MKRFTIIFVVLAFLLALATAALATPPEPKSLKIEGVPMTSLQAAQSQVLVLVANTGQTITYTTGTTHIVLSCDGHVWFDPAGSSSLTVPSANIATAIGPMLDPFNYLLNIGTRTTSGIVAPAATKCSMTEYKVISY